MHFSDSVCPSNGDSLRNFIWDSDPPKKQAFLRLTGLQQVTGKKICLQRSLHFIRTRKQKFEKDPIKQERILGLCSFESILIHFFWRKNTHWFFFNDNVQKSKNKGGDNSLTTQHENKLKKINNTEHTEPRKKNRTCHSTQCKLYLKLTVNW